MITVVATPDDWFVAFGAYLVLLVGLVRLSRVPPTYLLKRMVVEVPFVLFAALLPFVAHGPRVEVLGAEPLGVGPARGLRAASPLPPSG